MNYPLVAVLGRPNVGKSTLINRIITKREAIVHSLPGVTRDRKYFFTDWLGVEFSLIDTGGLDFGTDLPLAEQVVRQALLAVEEADLIIFVVDSITGILSDDEKAAQILRKSTKPKILVVNKVENLEREIESSTFYRLGLGEPILVSALHGLGINNLLDKIVEMLPKKVWDTSLEIFASIAIVGRPNVGKSSILNCLLGKERAIVNELPGTTRDAVNTFIKVGEENYCLIDTAGLKRKKQIKDAIEFYSTVRTLKNIDQADICLLILDASEKPTFQDGKICQIVLEKGASLVLLLNKWDLVKNYQLSSQEVIASFKEKLAFAHFAPMLKVSAKTGWGIDKIFPTIKKVIENSRKTISTPVLNSFLEDLRNEGYSISKRGKSLKLFYGTQVKVSPPTFIFFVNHSELVTKAYKKFLENKIRERFIFEGTPIKIGFRPKE